MTDEICSVQLSLLNTFSIEEEKQLLDLVYRDWDETQVFGENKERISLKPDVDMQAYIAMEKVGKFYLITVKDINGNIVGYSASVVLPDPVVKNTKLAYNNAIYLLPKYRGCGIGNTLIHATMSTATTFGASTYQWAIQANNTGLQRILEDAGCIHTEIILAKKV